MTKMPLTTEELGGPVSVPMLRALNDIAQGPVFRLRCGHFQGQQPGRIFIRRRTIASLKGRRFVTVDDLPDFAVRAEITEEGRSFLMQHPLRRELAVTL